MLKIVKEIFIFIFDSLKIQRFANIFFFFLIKQKKFNIRR